MRAYMAGEITAEEYVDRFRPRHTGLPGARTVSALVRAGTPALRPEDLAPPAPGDYLPPDGYEHLGEPAPYFDVTEPRGGYTPRGCKCAAFLMLGLAIGLVLVRGAYWLSGVIS